MGLFTDDASNIEVQAVFPDANSLGTVVNGEANKLILKFINSGTGNFTIVNAAASYHDVEKNWALVRNTTAQKFNVNLPAGANFSVPFTVHSDDGRFRPRDMGLTVWANLQDVQKDTHRFVAMNSTVSVVEPQGSWFDLGALFMYIILLTALGGLGYFGYNYLMDYLYPQQKRTRSKRTTSSTTTTTKIVPADSGKPYPESVKPYEEDWVPAHHLKPAAAPRRRKGAKVVDGAVSTGEVTSGGEGLTSGAESGVERKKGKKGRRN